MLPCDCPPPSPFPFPVAAAPLDAEARRALLPGRLLGPWLLARSLESALARLDLGCLASLCKGFGSAPCNPALMLALALFCIADGKPSPADWAGMANRDGPARWLAWGIEPSVSACYAFRDRLGCERLDELNRLALALALSDGLSACRAGSIDGTLVEANASRRRLANGKAVERALLELQEPASRAAPAAGEAPPAPEAQRTRRLVRPGRTPGGRARQRQRLQAAKEELGRRQRLNQGKRSSKRADPEKIVISPADPEAAVGRDKLDVFRPLYNAQLVADADSELVLGYQAFAQQNDAGLLGAMLDRAALLLGRPLEQALADGGYAGGQDLADAEARGVQVLAPLPSDPKGGQLPKSAFAWSAEEDRYVCPRGKTLSRAGQSRQKRSGTALVVLTQYKAEKSDCAACPQKEQCCPKSKTGRTISRSEHEPSIERLRERMKDAASRKRYKRRAATVERLFGDGKERRGLGRTRGRGLQKARIQLGLTVLQHNLRVLAKAAQTRAGKAQQAADQPLAT